MKSPVKRDRRQRIWRSLLRYMAERQEKEEEGVTAKDLADEINMNYPCILQVVRRLRTWGYLKLVGFNPPDGDRGRQRHVFEVTKTGMNKAAWEKGKRKRR